MKFIKNSYKILKNYENRDNFLKSCKDSIFKNIRIISGQKIEKQVKKYGLEKIHDFFPVEFIPFLQYAVQKDLKNKLYSQIFDVGLKNCKFKNNFLIDKTLNFRIHYPFSSEQKSKLSREIFRCLNLNNYLNAKEEFAKAKSNSKNYIFDNSDKTKIKYFGNNKTSCYLHSGHRDTWFAHSTEGLNFWWGITEVTEQNGMMLFREVTNYDLEHERRPAYVKDCYNLGKFEVPELKSGNLLIFDAEILHATRLNTSDKTRIVFSGRVNLTKPKFYNHSYDEKEPFWFKSQDIEKKIFSNELIFKREKKNFTNKKLKSLKKVSIKKIKINSKFSPNNFYKLKKKFPKEKDFKCIIIFKNVNIAFVKNNSGIYAFNSLCPHLSFNLIHSDIRNDSVKCQGHGLEFNIKKGKSSCNKFKIKTYKILTKNNYYYLKT